MLELLLHAWPWESCHRPSPHRPHPFVIIVTIAKTLSFPFCNPCPATCDFCAHCIVSVEHCGKITSFHAYKKKARTWVLCTPSSHSHSHSHHHHHEPLADSGRGYHSQAWGTPLAMPLHPLPLWVSPGGSPGTPHRQAGCGSWCPRDDQP